MSATLTTVTATVTMFGEEREVEFTTYGEEASRLTSRGLAVVGKFPTGTKLHGSSLTLWKRHRAERPDHPLRGATAAVVNGEEYVADYTLYIHNSNRGRIVAWNDQLANSEWRGY